MFAVSAFAATAQGPDLQAARQAMDAKQYGTAEQIYRKAVTADPNSANLLTDLGLSLQMQGRSADAMHYYALALKQEYIPETYALLAEERCRMGDVGRLRPMLAKIYREQRDNARVLTVVASCYLDADEPVESAMVYRALLKSGEYPADLALVESAKSYIRSGQLFAGKLSKASDAAPYMKALRDAPEGGAEAARSAFAEAARRSPYFKADLEWGAAVALWRQHPQDSALLYLLAVLSGEQGMRQVELCAQQFPASPYLAQFYADMLADQGHGDEAMAQYEQLAREHPELSELHYKLGLLREKREEWAAAADAFREQLAAYPGDERAAAHLSKCMLQMEQYAAVCEFLKPFMRAERPPQWASLNLAEAEQKLGDRDGAIKTLVAAERAPDADKVVHYRLTHLYSLAGREADARRELALFQAASKQ